jgi:hypothetical protein
LTSKIGNRGSWWHGLPARAQNRLEAYSIIT